MAKVSVIIPCYNQGAFLQEAVASVKNQTWDDLEIIIVNDGSDDSLTQQVCNSYDDPQITVLSTDNQGLASARNNGIKIATGAYILPLDADDLIEPEYIEEAVKILDTDENAGIVYCRAKLFGAVEGDWNLPKYHLNTMLMDNIIFCTALFRKSDWEAVGGYDTGMIYGWEDYDFWLSLLEKGRSVHCLDKPYFSYRVAPESMVRSKEKAQKVEMFKRIYLRHRELFSENIQIWLEHLVDRREQYLTGRLYVDCGSGVNDTDSIAIKIGPGDMALTFSIDTFSNPQALRFDPADSPVCIEVQSIQLQKENATVDLDIDKAGSNAVVKKDKVHMFSTDDPQMVLPVDPEMLSNATEVKISCTYRSFGDEALREIIEYQHQEIGKGTGRNLLSRWFN